METTPPTISSVPLTRYFGLFARSPDSPPIARKRIGIVRELAHTADAAEIVSDQRDVRRVLAR